MCQERFESRSRLTGKRPLHPRLIGVIFDKLTCQRRFERDIGGNALTYDFEMGVPKPERRCSCGTILATKHPRCRLCRIQKTIENKFKKHARKRRRFATERAAVKVFKLEDIRYVD